jgi:hypothetical protein
LQALAGNARPAVTDNNGCVSTELKASGVDARAEFNPNVAPTVAILGQATAVLARFGIHRDRPMEAASAAAQCAFRRNANHRVAFLKTQKEL